MKGGFKLLETRAIDNNIDIIQYEKLIGRKIPALLSIFLKTFIVQENCIKKEFYKYDNNLFYCGTFRYKQCKFSSKYPDNFIVFDDFVSVENSVNSYIENHQYNHDIRINDMLCVGIAGDNNGIFVGIDLEMCDKIYFVTESDFYQIADNIFDFVRSIEFLSNTEDMQVMDDVPYSQLYRNWGEDFWRVREDEA